MAEFTGDIRHIAGQDNVVADTLSRPPQAGATVAAVAATPQMLDYAAIAEAQRDCPSIQAAGDSFSSLSRDRSRCSCGWTRSCFAAAPR